MRAEHERGMSRAAVGAVLALASLGFAGLSGWRPWSYGTDLGDRLFYGIACLLPVAACLAVALGQGLAVRARGASAVPASDLAAQVALAAPAYIAAALLLPERWLGAVAGAGALFVIGSLTAARGRDKGASLFGAVLQYLPSALLLAASLVLAAAARP